MLAPDTAQRPADATVTSKAIWTSAPGIRMAANFTRADIGWYYMFMTRPDQIEYVCAKVSVWMDPSPSRRRGHR